MIDMRLIRQQLNERAFENGKRTVSLGFVSELFAKMTPTDAEHELKRIEEQLAQHDLTLARGGEEEPQLYAVQTLKHRPPDLAWMARGMEWVAKITTVALEMVVPIVIGMWLDRQFATRFLAPLGIVVGVPLGIWHLVKMTKREH